VEVLPVKVDSCFNAWGPHDQLAAVYQYTKCTPDVWQHLVDTVQQQGSLAGMLQLKAGPLVHSGYRLAVPADGCDLQHIGLSVPLRRSWWRSWFCWCMLVASSCGAGCQRHSVGLYCCSVLPTCCVLTGSSCSNHWLLQQCSKAMPCLQAATAVVLSAINSAAAVAVAKQQRRQQQVRQRLR
jgi:hypothetical protein